MQEREDNTMCNHAVEHLVGTGDGIKCRLCGKVFKDWKELEADRPQEEKPVEEEKPKKAATKKKGAKK